jgi:hypothetical protein
VGYLSAAASNAATVESMALQAGVKKGGAAKGELVLAIFELANCFRHGWGIPKDPVAAKQVSLCRSAPESRRGRGEYRHWLRRKIQSRLILSPAACTTKDLSRLQLVPLVS